MKEWVELAEKVKTVLVKKKPTTLSLYVSDDKAMIYVDGALEMEYEMKKSSGSKGKEAK